MWSALERIKRAHVVLLPKVTGVLSPSSFRPVALQNCSVKAITFRLQQQIGTIIRSHYKKYVNQ
jgi:hypothetical protein